MRKQAVKFKKMVPDSVIVKGILGIIIWVMTFIPAYVGGFVWWLASPETEMGRIALGGLLILFGGGFQVFCLFVGVIFTLALICEDI